LRVQETTYAVSVTPSAKLLVSRDETAQLLSINVREASFAGRF
jgi:hypothetical protein